MVRRRILRFLKDQSGATAIEYGLIVGLIAVGIIASLTLFGGSIAGMFGVIENKAGGAMDKASGAGN
jgi:pilus assembly protein Flp/PilA